MLRVSDLKYRGYSTVVVHCFRIAGTRVRFSLAPLLLFKYLRYLRSHMIRIFLLRYIMIYRFEAKNILAAGFKKPRLAASTPEVITSLFVFLG